jgi:hypothetical protein
MAKPIPQIRYSDIVERELETRARLTERLNQLERSALSRAGAGVGGQPAPIFYTVEEKQEHDDIANVLDVIANVPGEYCDPLFVAARDQFNLANLIKNGLGNPEGDLTPTPPPGVALQDKARPKHAHLSAQEAVDVALTLGILAVDAATPPPVKIAKGYPPAQAAAAAAPGQAGAVAAPAQAGGAVPDPVLVTNIDDSNYPAMRKSFFKALGEAESYKPLSMRVLAILAEQNDGDPIVSTGEFAQVMRVLVQMGITSNETQLGRKVSEALDQVQNVSSDPTSASIGIDLPDLDQQGTTTLVPNNIRLMGPVIVAAMFDELKVFQVVDKLVENAQNGILAIGKGDAGALLYKRWKEAPNRMSEPERRDLYAMTMGQPGGNPAIQGNTDFNDLWLRFVSSVSQYVRAQDIDKLLLRSTIPAATGAQQMRKAARDLATNLSLHGFGMTYYAAIELQNEIKEMIKLLSDSEIIRSTGAANMWGVIDIYATTQLGGARNSQRYRTLATCGAIITAWLANNVDRIDKPMGQLIDIMDVRSPMPRSNGVKATTNPYDFDMVNACELWLADTAVSDTRVDEMSQPRVSPAMTSQPVPIPAMAREFMDEIPGLTAGLPTGMALAQNLRNGSGARH